MTETKAPLRVALIGLGYFSQFHIRAWNGIDGVTLVGACDTELSRVEHAERNLGIVGFSSLDAMLERCDPDIIDIVTPALTHASLIRACLEAGRVLVCQKPFCQTLTEAESVVLEAELAQTTLIIHENFRFQPWYRALKTYLDSEGFGRIYQARFALRPGDGRGNDAYRDRQPSFRTMERFLMRETGVHFIDLFQWLFGEIATVSADLRKINPAIAGEDAGLAIFTHANGTRSIFDGNRLSDHLSDQPRRTMGEMWIEGEGGTIRLDGFGRLWLRRFSDLEEMPIPIDAPIDEDSFGGGCVEALCRHIVTQIRTGAPIENPAREYLTVMRLLDATYHAAETGTRQQIAPRPS